MTPAEREEAVQEVARTALSIEPILHGRDRGIQGAILADLLATWLKGHNPEIREKVLTIHMRLVRKLTEVPE